MSKTSSIHHVLFYIYYDELETLGPYLYGIRMWHERGYDVSVYSLTDDEGYQRLPEEVRSQFAHRTVRFPPWVKMCSLGLQGLGFATRKLFRLKTRGSDSLDFYDLGVACLRDALKDAFGEGYRRGQKDAIPPKKT